MGRLLKKYLGLIIIIIILLVFPISLSNQARLNNRIIVTGLAIDKSGDKYDITAQYVKTTPGTESGGSSAEINFVTDSDASLVSAIEKLSYKAGKVAAFSHTNFIVVGKDCLTEDLTQMLDYFVRNKTIKSSALLLFADEKAADEIKKTKDVELSVGLGLQKVFLVKENEGDGEMTTILNFLKDAKSYSQTSTASTLKLMKNTESRTSSQSAGDSGTQSSSTGSDETEGTGSSSGEENSQSSSGSGGSEGSESSNSSSSSESSSSGESSGDKYKYFEALAPIVCHVNGRFAGKLETPDEVTGYMIAKSKSETEDISLKNINGGRFKDAIIGIKVNHKHSKKAIRYENSTPCLDIKITISNSEIEDLQNEEMISEISAEEYEIIKKEIEKDTARKIAACFEKSRSFKADVFHAYDIANKFCYKKTNKYYSDMQSFLSDLKLNVEVEVVRLDY